MLVGVVSVAPDKTLRITAELEDLRAGWCGIDCTGPHRRRNPVCHAVGHRQCRIPIAGRRPRRRTARRRTDLAHRQPQGLQQAVRGGTLPAGPGQPRSLPEAIALFDRAIALDPKVLRRLYRLAATPTASCSPTRAAGQHAAGGDRLDRRGAVAPRLCRAWSSLGPDLRDGLALEGRVDGAPTRDGGAVDTGPDRTGQLCSGLGGRTRSSARSRQRSPGPAERKWRIWGTGPDDGRRTRRAWTWAERKMRQRRRIGLVFSGAGVGASIAGDHERAVRSSPNTARNSTARRSR